MLNFEYVHQLHFQIHINLKLKDPTEHKQYNKITKVTSLLWLIIETRFSENITIAQKHSFRSLC